LARHPQRPYLLDYIERIFTDWSEIHATGISRMMQRLSAA